MNCLKTSKLFSKKKDTTVASKARNTTKKYKLIYFNLRGRAEVIRWMFAVAGVQYEDFRINSIEEWKALKFDMPFDQVPVLEVDGVQIAQTAAICRYLAAEFGLTASVGLDCARGDMIVDSVNDLLVPLAAVVRETYRSTNGLITPELEVLLRIFSDDTIPSYMNNFEYILKQNRGGDGYFLGSKITWVDIFFTSHMHLVTTFSRIFSFDFQIENWPKLQGLIKRVNAHPSIADWIQKRPVTGR